MSLAALADEVKIYPQVLINVPVADKKKTLEGPALLAAVKEEEEKLGDDGRILVRASGTEPLVRVMVEAQTDAICKDTADRLVSIIEKKD